MKNLTSHLPASVGYKGSDVKTGPGGYAKIKGMWLTLDVRENLFDENGTLMLPKALSVSELAWGETYRGELDDFAKSHQLSAEEIEELMETLTDGEREKAEALGLKKR